MTFRPMLRLHEHVQGGLRKGEMFCISGSIGTGTHFRRRVVPHILMRLREHRPVIVLVPNSEIKADWEFLLRDYDNEGQLLQVMTVIAFKNGVRHGMPKVELKNTVCVIDEVHPDQRKSLKAHMFKRIGLTELIWNPLNRDVEGFARYNANPEDLPVDGPR